MRFLHTMIRVKNLDESLKFYCEILGFKEVRRTDNEQGRFSLIFLAAPADYVSAQTSHSPLIELTYNWPDENGNTENLQTGRSWGHMAFEVDDIYSFCDHLVKSGVIINRPPRDGYMAFIKSPDNVSIEILQASSALAPKEPWASMQNQGSW